MFFFDWDPDDDWTIFVCDKCGYQEEEMTSYDDFPCPECGEGICRMT